jgi:hypothetical protein
MLTITTSTVVAWKNKTTPQRTAPLQTIAKSPIHNSTYPKLKHMSDCIKVRV